MPRWLEIIGLDALASIAAFLVIAAIIGRKRALRGRRVVRRWKSRPETIGFKRNF